MTVPARLPEFPASLRWLDRPPLRAATALRGHVVALLCWRLGCTHSLAALADLARLQAEFAGRPFAAIALHVAVAAGEHDPARLARAVARLAAPLTVAADPEREFVRALRPAVLPFLVLADPTGAIRFAGGGELLRLRCAEAIESLLRPDLASAPFAPCRGEAPPRLAPAGLALDGARLWVASAGHRRIYELDAGGAVLRSCGEGLPGARDGGPGAARFDQPRALLAHGDGLLVADAGSHTLRAIDPATLAVTTCCGTGQRGHDRFGGGYGVRQALCAPAGLCAHDGGVIVAQQGAHQLWQFDPTTQAATTWLGSGVRSLRDGGDEATFTEPCAAALARDRATLYVADAGNGALRAVDLAHAFVRTVAQGLGRPSAVAVHGDDVLVAASWQPAVLVFRGGGGPSEVLFDAAAGLVEPAALALDGTRLWIADAGADCLFAGDLADLGAGLQRVPITGAPPLPERPDVHAARLGTALVVREHGDASLRIALPCGSDVLDAGAPCEVELADEADPVLAGDRHAVATVADGEAAITVPFAAAGAGVLRVRVKGTVRRGPEAKPVARTWRYVVRITVRADGPLAGRLEPLRA